MTLGFGLSLAGPTFGRLERVCVQRNGPSNGPRRFRGRCRKGVSMVTADGEVRQYYRRVPPSPADLAVSNQIQREDCFNLQMLAPLTEEQENVLKWLLSETFEPEKFGQTSSLEGDVIEVGPRLNFQTAWSANAVSIFHACGLNSVARLERSRRYSAPDAVSAEDLYDRMTEQIYSEPLQSFDAGLPPPSPTKVLSLCEKGSYALEVANEEQGLGFDEADIEYYTSLFREKLRRDPTDVEIFDMAQSNSEHSRHWFFGGKIVIDGVEMKDSLLSLVKQTLLSGSNSVIAFADNSSTIRGIDPNLPTLLPSDPAAAAPSAMKETTVDYDILFTAETHNFPSGVAPFPGAETGAGGRLRDTAATGTGSLIVAGTAGYSVGSLRIPGYDLPWEKSHNSKWTYPSNLASPLQILIQASNGASDYGNKFGEPLINGFTRSYGLRAGEEGERREYVKPIMFSGGMGMMRHAHAVKGEPEVGHWVVKVGGPAYRIGLGGGAASSMVQGENKEELDFNAVQRGDAEMEQKVYRVLRACVEMGDDENPIVSIHDQGAGGNCNVVKELIYPSGAKIDLRTIWVGDKSLSALEIWGAEYQEQFGLILHPDSVELFQSLCRRENVVPSFLGQIDGSGRIVLWDEEQDMAVVDLDLEDVLGDLPRKTFADSRRTNPGRPLAHTLSASVDEALDRVLRLVTVGSKRFLTTKVDRSVTGLVAQQQCVGPLHLPLADVAVTAHSHFAISGSATAIGERPNLTAISPQAMARMTVGEMVTNITAARITKLKDIKCEGNWMWAAKLPGEGAAIYDAAVAMRDVMLALGIAVDGGKDSVSMAAKCPKSDDIPEELVKAPGTLVVTGYAGVMDVAKVLTPDIKRPGESEILLVDLADGKRRLGGSSLSQVFHELGDSCPDMDNSSHLKLAFQLVQDQIEREALLSYHDISDGGLLVALLEMAFGGNCGLTVVTDRSTSAASVLEYLFAEELGMLIEVPLAQSADVMREFLSVGISCAAIATTHKSPSVKVEDKADGVLLHRDTYELQQVWEATSFEIEKLQASVPCVERERSGLLSRTGPKYSLSFTPQPTPPAVMEKSNKPKVAIVRQEGSNGDREMSSAFHLAGFEAWDVCVNDIASGVTSLEDFRGVAFVGGFSFADVLDSAKGWAGVLLFKKNVKEQFAKFFERDDTFSLGVCNGCQLMALLGIVPSGSMSGLAAEKQPRFVHNDSGRFESRFTTVKIASSPAIMFAGMEGSTLGVWSAHGEGKAVFPSAEVLTDITEKGLVPLHYVDDDSTPTTEYPFNPNGSAHGIAGLCSADGRHLAMMPHPERTVLSWQWPWIPSDLNEEFKTSPWLRMFQSARAWCDAD